MKEKTKNLLFIATVSAASHSLKVTLAVDDSWQMYVGNTTHPAQMVTVNKAIGGWSAAESYSKPFNGETPFVVGVKGIDLGGAGGMIASVSVDGSIYSLTGTPNSKWQVTTVDPTGTDWLNPDFDAWGWDDAVSTGFCNVVNSWTDAMKLQFNAQSPNSTAAWPVWTPSCSSTTPNRWFRILVVPPGSSWTQPSSWKSVNNVKLVLAVDDNWILYPGINGTPINKITGGWSTSDTVLKKISGATVFGVKGIDGGGAGGMIASVSIDGSIYSLTGTPNSKWQVTTVDPTGTDWLNPYFESPAWQDAVSTGFCNVVNSWTDAMKLQFNAQSPNSTAAWPVWTPSCTSTTPNRWFRIVVVPQGSPPAPRKHKLQITLAVDDVWSLSLDGYNISKSVAGSNVAETLSFTVQGKGPWIIGVTGFSSGGTGGLISSIFLDGALYSETGTASSKWLMTNQMPIGNAWLTNSTFNTDSWIGTSYPPSSCLPNSAWTWPTLMKTTNFNTLSPNNTANLIWTPTCNSGLSYNWFRIVVRPPAIKCRPH